MKGTYKPPHTSLDNMNTYSNTSKLDSVDEQLKKIRDDIVGLNEKLDTKLEEKKLDEKLDTKPDEKLNNFKWRLIERLMGMPTLGIPKENHWIAVHIEPHQEETSNSGLFSHPQTSLGLQNSNSMDNNIWHHSPKVDLNNADGSNPSVWVTQMEHYFSLQGISNDMMKLTLWVLYLDPE